jgi:hypothetical protein
VNAKGRHSQLAQNVFFVQDVLCLFALNGNLVFLQNLYSKKLERNFMPYQIDCSE